MANLIRKSITVIRATPSILEDLVKFTKGICVWNFVTYREEEATGEQI